MKFGVLSQYSNFNHSHSQMYFPQNAKNVVEVEAASYEGKQAVLERTVKLTVFECKFKSLVLLVTSTITLPIGR